MGFRGYGLQELKTLNPKPWVEGLRLRGSERCTGRCFQRYQNTFKQVQRIAIYSMIVGPCENASERGSTTLGQNEQKIPYVQDLCSTPLDVSKSSAQSAACLGFRVWGTLSKIQCSSHMGFLQQAFSEDVPS